MKQSESDTVRIVGIDVDRLNCAGAIDQIRSRVAERQNTLVYFINAHCVNLACRTPGYREVLARADLRLNDGSGLSWAARRYGIRFEENCVGTDFVPKLCSETRDDGLSFFLLGGKDGVAQKAADAWQQAYPGLKIAGTHHGYIERNEAAETDVIHTINRSGADILLVAMGMPLQEQWIDRNRSRLTLGATLAVGALFDFAAGTVPRAPQWMIDRGVEWIYRLRIEPGRLWQRYLIGNPLFVTRVLIDRFTGGRSRG